MHLVTKRYLKVGGFPAVHLVSQRMTHQQQTVHALQQADQALPSHRQHAPFRQQCSHLGNYTSNSYWGHPAPMTQRQKRRKHVEKVKES